MWRQLRRIAALLALALVALQLGFALRIAVMAPIDPRSTSFQRSEAWRLLTRSDRFGWAHQWVDADAISPNLKRAVIASEDAGFIDHDGVEWDAIEQALRRNQRAQERAARAQARNPQRPVRIKVVGGSTITQQLAKNLFLSGNRSYLRKGQELVITYMLETVMTKRRILELYLNVAEWGVGVFGAEAGARHYYGVPAAQLGPGQAARMAAMLPRPRYYDAHRGSPALARRTAIVARWMGAVDPP